MEIKCLKGIPKYVNEKIEWIFIPNFFLPFVEKEFNKIKLTKMEKWSIYASNSIQQIFSVLYNIRIIKNKG